MTSQENLGFVMLGYERAIAALNHLDFQSDTIQRLVFLMYQLDCGGDEMSEDTAETRKDFATERIQTMAEHKEQYLDLFGEEAFEYILNAIFYFGDL